MIKNVADLRSSIEELEGKKILLEGEIQRSFRDLKDQFSPINAIKNTFFGSKSNGSSTIKSKLWKVALGIGAVLLAKKAPAITPKGSLQTGVNSLVNYGVGRFLQSGKHQTEIAAVSTLLTGVITYLLNKKKSK